MKQKIYICNFSGGKDSTAMLFKLLENNKPIDYIIFCDTGVEFPEVYKHINKVNTILQNEYGKQITFIKPKLNFIEYMTVYKRKRGNNKGLPYFFPSHKNRWCSEMLKLYPIYKFKKQLVKQAVNKQLVFIEYIGYSLNEIKRTKRAIKRTLNKNKRNKQYKEYLKFPLIYYKMNTKDILEYCYSLGFNWDGLYEHIDRASCFTCPFTNNKELKYLITQRPELWAVIKKLELNLKKLGISTWKYKPNKSTEEIEAELLS